MRDTQDPRVQRAAAAALQHALRAVRLHPDNDRLTHAALRSCHDTIARATAAAPLALPLQDARFADDPALQLLREAGVGAIVFAPNVSPADVDRLVRRIAGLDAHADAEASLHGLVAADGLRDVRFTTAEHLPWNDGEAQDWSFLPPPRDVAPALQALVARDEAANLPALAARMALDDLGCAPAFAACLLPLLRRLLDANDLATATWLLEETERETAVPAATRFDLRDLAIAVATPAWLRHRVDAASRDELLQLAAFALQLGDDVTRALAALVRDADNLSAPLVLDLLGD